MKEKILKELNILLNDLSRNYYENGNQDFDAGRIDGIKQAIEKIEKI